MFTEGEFAAVQAGADQALAAHREELMKMDMSEAADDFSQALLACAKANAEWSNVIEISEHSEEVTREEYILLLKAIRMGTQNLGAVVSTMVQKVEQEITYLEK